MKNKSYLSWTWIVFLAYMGISVIDIRFGLFGFVCMLSPVVLALAGKKKTHCNKFCPRASFLKNFMGRVSLKNTLPKPLRTDAFRWILLSFMMAMFAFSLYRTGGDPTKIAFVMFRMIAVSSVVSLLMGFFYKERSWCAVCPMGFSAKLIGNGLVPQKKEVKSVPRRKAS